tara:strand:- start:4032 stop:5756 length:1725 start_codon:yes stop_codon:yes gene_type:complete
MKNDTNGRRDFIKNSGLAFSLMALNSNFLMANEDNGMGDELLKKLSSFNDGIIEPLLLKQISHPDSRWDGGVKDIYEVPHAHATMNFVIKLSSAYASPFSKFYLSNRLRKAITKAMKCIVLVQHDDGTIDLHSTNFHSTPDTAFFVNYLSPVYIVLKSLDQLKLKDLISYFEIFLKKTSKCLLIGGAHTANHRWVICSALARLNSFFPSSALVDRIDTWLNEGVDLDPDGQYTEKSVGAYSPVCNEMFITMGRLMNRDDLLDVARKNLNMTLYYIQPGGEVLTNASGRQDSENISDVTGYYYSYLYFSHRDKNPVYAAVCDFIENKLPHKLTPFITYLLEDKSFRNKRISATQFPKQYFKRFKYSGVFRIRQSNFDVSIIENNPTFLSLIKGSAVLQSIRLGSTFFGSRGQFTAENVEVKKNQIILTKSVKHGYFQPFPKNKIIGDGVYSKMPREERRLSEPQVINYKLIITILDQIIQLSIEVTGTEHVLVSLEMNFRKGGKLSGVISDKNRADSYFLKEDWGTYEKDDNVITFGPGKIEHQWGTMRGMQEKPNGNTVYINGHTPFKHVIEIS